MTMIEIFDWISGKELFVIYTATTIGLILFIIIFYKNRKKQQKKEEVKFSRSITEPIIEDLQKKNELDSTFKLESKLEDLISIHQSSKTNETKTKTEFEDLFSGTFGATDRKQQTDDPFIGLADDKDTVEPEDNNPSHDKKDSISGLQGKLEIKAPRIFISYARVDDLSMEKVEFAVFAPQHITRGDKFILDLWAYEPMYYSSISEFSRKLGREKPLGEAHGAQIKKNTQLNITLEINMLDVEDPTDTIFWEGGYKNVSFVVNVPINISTGPCSGRVIIGCHGIPIAKIKFIVLIEGIRNSNYVNITGEQFYPKTAFASYATENRADVLSRIQGIKKVAPDLDIFFDVFSLRSGEDWEKKLENHVPNKDIFYLFWSRFAVNSKWVEREWRLALSKRGLNYIDPVPLEDIRDAPPPSELKALHFNDSYILY